MVQRQQWPRRCPCSLGQVAVRRLVPAPSQPGLGPSEGSHPSVRGRWCQLGAWGPDRPHVACLCSPGPLTAWQPDSQGRVLMDRQPGRSLLPPCLSLQGHTASPLPMSWVGTGARPHRDSERGDLGPYLPRRNVVSVTSSRDRAGVSYTGRVPPTPPRNALGECQVSAMDGGMEAEMAVIGTDSSSQMRGVKV